MIRLAHDADLSRLGAVEASAAARFRGTALDWLADAPTTPDDALRVALDGASLWVAAGPDDAPLGFLLAEPVVPWLHILELSVTLAAQGHGYGTALLAAAAAAAPKFGCDRVSLTTDRHLAWNAPWYARRDFVEVAAADQPDWLAAIIDREVASGLVRARRMALRRDPA